MLSYLIRRAARNDGDFAKLTVEDLTRRDHVLVDVIEPVAAGDLVASPCTLRNADPVM